MKLSALLIFLAAFAASPALSQDKAHDILDKVAANTKEMGAVKIIFTYSMTNEEAGINESYRGEILAEGEKYRLRITGQEIISNGENTWTYIPDAQEVQLNDAAEDGNEFNPSELLTNYKENYEASFVEEKTLNNRSMAVLKLIPLSAGDFEKAHLTVDLVKNEIFRLTIFDGTDNQYTYEVEELLPGISLNGDEFTFDKDKHPEVDIIDMR